MRRVLVTAAALALTLPGLVGCGDDEEDPGPAPGTKTIEITFADGTVTPNGERLKVKAGQPIELVVKADEPGEIHVHSAPEQEFSYGEGTNTLQLTIETTGLVDVESHNLDQVIVQLQVE